MLPLQYAIPVSYHEQLGRIQAFYIVLQHQLN